MADASDLKSGGGKSPVRVRVPPPADLLSREALMALQFDEDGIRFRYPENWRLEREENDAGWTISLQSPDTAFMVISLRDDISSTDEMAETTLAALRED